jgi:hypothetical protein
MISTARWDNGCGQAPFLDTPERDVKARVLAIEVEQLTAVRAEQFV